MGTELVNFDNVVFVQPETHKMNIAIVDNVNSLVEFHNPKTRKIYNDRCDKFKEWLELWKLTCQCDAYIRSLCTQIILHFKQLKLSTTSINIDHIYLNLHMNNTPQDKQKDIAEHVMRTLNGKYAVDMNDDLTNTIIEMFCTIQIPTEKYLADKESLSFKYVLHKILELINHPDLAALCQLNNSRKRQIQDEIWKHICSDIGWEYINKNC